MKRRICPDEAFVDRVHTLHKTTAVIYSCKNLEQFRVAQRYATLAKKYFSELGGKYVDNVLTLVYTKLLKG
jgi:hypothetical protein